MKCSNCGNALEENAQFCPRCGRPARFEGDVLREGDEKAVMPMRIGDLLSGRYKLQEKVGEGGMGAVYTAHDSELDRQIAVKLLASNLVNDADVVERFEREARLTAKLDHPNIVPVYDVGRHQGRPFIVMKRLEGDTLSALLRAKGGLTSDETLKLLRQLAAGLDYIHQRGFIHRDIKAGNIFVGSEGLATILDFGILRPKSASEGLTRTGMVMGTPHYMAPEQALGSKNVDHRVDLYALAVVLFECLTGTLPFEADSELRLIQMQAHSPPPDLIDRAPWISRPVAEVVKRSLSKRPDDRFSSGAELVRALETAYRDSKHEISAVKPSDSAAAPTKIEPIISPITSPSWRKRSDELPLADSQPPPPVDSPPLLPPPPRPHTEVLRHRDPPTRAFAPGNLPSVLGFILGIGLILGLAIFRPWERARLPIAVDAGADDAGAPSWLEQLDAGDLFNTNALPFDAGDLLEADADAGIEGLDLTTEELADGGRVKTKSAKKKEKGKLNVLTMHQGEPYWAQVSVDGVARGRTPLLLELPFGKHQVTVERTGFRTQSREIRVASGPPAVVRIDLTP